MAYVRIGSDDQSHDDEEEEDESALASDAGPFCVEPLLHKVDLGNGHHDEHHRFQSGEDVHTRESALLRC